MRRDPDGMPSSIELPRRSGPSVLVLPQNFNDGWVARVGNQELEPQRADGWKQGWLVPGGDATKVTVEYRPETTFRIALGAGLLGILLCLVGAVVRPAARPAVPGRPALAGAGTGRPARRRRRARRRRAARRLVRRRRDRGRRRGRSGPAAVRRLGRPRRGRDAAGGRRAELGPRSPRRAGPTSGARRGAWSRWRAWWPRSRAATPGGPGRSGRRPARDLGRAHRQRRDAQPAGRVDAAEPHALRTPRRPGISSTCAGQH